MGGTLLIDDAALGVDQNVIGLHSDLRQHGAQDCSLVFAIAVSMREDVRGIVRTPAAHADADVHIADIMLSKMRKRLDALHQRHVCGREFLDFLLQAGIDIRTPVASRVYHDPMSAQLRKLLPGILSLRKVNTTSPANVPAGGRRGSFSIRGTSVTCQ